MLSLLALTYVKTAVLRTCVERCTVTLLKAGQRPNILDILVSPILSQLQNTPSLPIGNVFSVLYIVM